MNRTEPWPVGTRVVMVSPTRDKEAGFSALGWTGVVDGVIRPGEEFMVRGQLLIATGAINSVTFDNGVTGGCDACQLRPIENPDPETADETEVLTT